MTVSSGSSARSLVTSASRRAERSRRAGPTATAGPWRRPGGPAGAPVPSRSTSASSGSRWCSRRSPAAYSRPSKVSSTTRVTGRAGSDLEPGVLQGVDDRVGGEVGVGEGGGHRGGAAYVSGRRAAVGRGPAQPRAVGWSSMIEAAGGVVWKVTSEGCGEGAPGPPPSVRRLVVPEGQARSRARRHRQAALREVEEETGLRCRTGDELPEARYADRKGRPKRVRYWSMEPIDGEFAPERRGRRGALAVDRRGDGAAQLPRTTARCWRPSPSRRR